MFVVTSYEKILYKKNVRETVDDNILTEQYFPRAHTEQRNKLETCLITVGANSSLVLGREKRRQTCGSWRPFLIEPVDRIKATGASQLIRATVFPY